MTKQEKTNLIGELTQVLNEYPHIYLADTSGLNASQTQELRQECFNKNVKLIVVKNTLLKKAIVNSEKELSELEDVLKQPTALMLSEVGNAPAKLIKNFRKKGFEKPTLKAAYVEESIYVGEDKLDLLSAIKSKEELIGDIIMLLKSPMSTVLSQLNSAKNILAGVTKTLSERN